MRSSDALARPPEWPARDPARYRSAIVFVTAIGALCVAAGIGFVAVGLASALGYALLLGVLFFLTAAYGLVTKVRRAPRPDDVAITEYEGRPATEIRYSGPAFLVLGALVGCLAALCTLAAVDFATAGDEVPAAPVAAVLCGLGAGFFLSFFVFVAIGRLSRGRLVLAPQGIHQRGRAFTSFLPWEAFAGVKAADNGTPEALVIAYANAPWDRRQLGGVWKLDKLPPVPMIEIDTTNFAVDPVVLYHLVRFYVENPEARAELGTETSLQRVRTAAFG
ncbi:hypothetical protein B0I33_11152 [Prauserella shujinwangii]|uniref:Uncharacterized protein n=1 Tax=Prauserella shujinwangii TaxID=1453103 RepID=A0A2T0LMY0_9PSEU|nr:hypothetical protein [Prauserella shujinwangii]PRX44543.1 hypothetical protein B0I33_11152 [Prauserella shujinwangii]